MAGNPVPIATGSGTTDQAGCAAVCNGGSEVGCLSYSVSSGTCVIYGGYVSQWEDPTGTSLIAWDASCPVLSDYCGYLADAAVAGSSQPAPFAEYCYQLCSTGDCVTYSFDSVNLICQLYQQTVAVINPNLDANGVAFYDISCVPPTYPTSACSVYAGSNAASTAALQIDNTGITIEECYYDVLNNYASYSYYTDSNGLTHCQLYNAPLASLVPPPDVTHTTVWNDATCPDPATITP